MNINKNDFLFKFFSHSGEKATINGKEEVIYDIPLIYALYNKTPNPLQGEVEYIEVVEDTLKELNYDLSDIFLFRRKFVQNFISFFNIDFTLDYNDVSKFLVTTAEHKIYSDIQLKKIRPVVFFYINSTSPDFDGTVLEEERDVYDIEEEELSKYEKEFLSKHLDKEIVDIMFKGERTIDFDVLRNEFLKDLFGKPFKPQGRQKYFLKYQRRFNFVAASRRAGKTTLAAYLIIRQIILPKQEVVVVVPTLKNHSLPLMKTIKEFLSKYLGKTFKVDSQQHVITNLENYSTVKFYTGEKTDAIRGAAANLLVCDEAAILNEELYETASALLRTTKGVAYIISTVNPHSPKNWFYYNLISAEIESVDPNSNKLGMRVTLDDNPFVPDEDKEDIKKDADKNYNFFLAERYCTFIGTEDFNLKNFWVVDNNPVEVYIGNMWKVPMYYKVFEKGYTNYIINYDCAQNKDRAAVTVFGIDSRKDGDIVDVVMAEYMDGFGYGEQVKLLKDLKEMLGNSKIVIDYGGPGVVIQQMFERENIQTLNVQSVGGNYEGDDGDVFRVGKDILKAKLQSFIWENKLRGFSFQKFLRIEFETYDESKNRKHGHHNDMISSLMIGSYILDRFNLVSLPYEKNEEPEKGVILDVLGRPIYGENSFSRYQKFGF